MGVECELLISNFRDPKTIGLVKEGIGRISDGSSPHCADALKLVFKRASELKIRHVALRCSYSYCSAHNEHISYTSARSGVYCPSCYGSRNYLDCAGCGYNRTSSHRSCQNCCRKFK